MLTSEDLREMHFERPENRPIKPAAPEPKSWESLTWGDFKRIVEAEGITDDCPIWYIDISHPCHGDVLSVGKDVRMGLSVTK